MSTTAWNLEFLNHNSNRSFPLAMWGSKTDRTESVRIPDGLILSLDFPVHSGLNVDPSKFFIQQLAIYPTGINIRIGYDNNTRNGLLVASVNIGRSSHAEYRSYAVPGSGDFDDCVGRIVIGSMAVIDDLPGGVFDFDPAATPLEVSAIRPMARGISSIAVTSNGNTSVRLYGDIEFRAGDNMRITVNSADTASPEIVFSAISGEGLNDVCGCDNETTAGEPIRFINGIPPLPNGNFRIVGDSCLTVNPITNGLSLEDVCSQPCCGCTELDPLVAELRKFADGAKTLEAFVGNLNAQISQMNQVVLGSRLGGNVCLEC